MLANRSTTSEFRGERGLSRLFSNSKHDGAIFDCVVYVDAGCGVDKDFEGTKILDYVFFEFHPPSANFKPNDVSSVNHDVGCDASYPCDPSPRPQDASAS